LASIDVAMNLPEQAEMQARLYALNPGTDAFARTRVSDPITILDSALIYDLQPNVWESVVTAGGAAAHLPAEAAASLTVGTAGDSIVRQTLRYARYSPGKSHLILETGTFPEATEGITARIGYYDDNDGLFFQQDENGMSVNQRTSTSGSAVTTSVPQASWNFDVMDGTGMSGLTLDPTKANIYGWAIEWLGVGVTTAFVVIDGAIWPVHRFYNANALTSVYMRSATLPLRYELSSTAGASSMKQICSTVISEGGDALASASSFTASNGTTTRTGIAAATPVIAIRPSTTFNGLTNRMTILPNAADLYIASPSDNPVYWRLVRGGTVAGGTWGSADANSGVLVNTTGTAITGGVAIAAGYDRPSTGTDIVGLETLAASDLSLTLDAAGSVATELALVVTPLTGTVTAGAVLKWLEAR
jgi:hypothetical protein